jgi:hypothetical protein
MPSSPGDSLWHWSSAAVIFDIEKPSESHLNLSEASSFNFSSHGWLLTPADEFFGFQYLLVVSGRIAFLKKWSWLELYWLERYGMLSKSQYGFRKGRGTPTLSTDIQTSSETKWEMVCALFEAQISREIIQIFWGLFWRKEMVFYFENKPLANSVGYKGLPHGSCLSRCSLGWSGQNKKCEFQQRRGLKRRILVPIERI